MKIIPRVWSSVILFVLIFGLFRSASADQISISIQLSEVFQANSPVIYGVNIGLTASNGPITYYEVISPNAAFVNTIGNGPGGYGSAFQDIGSMLDSVTNGLWTVIINGGDPSAETNYFEVTLSPDVTNELANVSVTFPLNNSSGITNDPTFTWTTGLTNEADLSVDAHDANYNVYTSADLPVNSTNWTAGQTLNNGLNFLDITYTNGDAGKVTISTPTNTAGVAQTNLTITAGFNVQSTVDFYVGPLPALMAHYTFDDPINLNQDSSGNGLNLQGPTWFGPVPSYSTNGVEGGAIQFYASAWYTFPSVLVPVLASNFSLSVWINTTNTVGNDTDYGELGAGVVVADNAYGPNNCIPLNLTGHKGSFYTGDTGDTLQSVSDVVTGQYVHVVVTRDMATGQKSMYVNGVLDNSDIGGTGLLDNSAGIFLADNDIESEYYAGLLDDMQIYSTVLSPDQVSYLYNNPGQTATNAGQSNFNLALDTTNLNWLTFGDANWFSETTNTYDGISAAESGSVTNNEESVLQTTITGPAEITFEWQSAANDGNFYLEFDVDSNYFDSIAFGSGWVQEQPFTIGAGTHLLQWIAYANGATDPTDEGYLGDISISPDVPPTITVNPVSQTDSSGYPAALTVAATGVPTPTYQWFMASGSPIAGATSTFFIPSDSGFPPVAGGYYAVASNEVGTATSTTAQITFNYTLPPPPWTQAFKSPFQYQDYFLGSIAEVDGSLYLAAEFGGTNYVGTNYLIAGSGGDGAAVVKYPTNSNGNQTWVAAITNNGMGFSYGLEVAPAPVGGVYFMGNLTGTNYLGLIPMIDSGGGSVFLARFDSNGLPIWAEVLGQTGSSFSELHCLASDDSGNVTVSALFSGMVSLGGSNLTLSGQVPCVASFDLNGNLRWIDQSSGFAQGLASSGGTLYAAMGNSSTNVAIGGLTNHNDRAWTLVALNPTNGQGIWSQGIGAALGDGDPNGVVDDVPRLAVSGTNIFLAGTAYGPDAEFGGLSVQFTNMPGNYVARCDTNGVPQILTAFGSPTTRPFAAGATAEGELYVAGDFDGVSYFGSNSIAAPRLAAPSPTDFGSGFVAKFDVTGNALWAQEAKSLQDYVDFRGLAVVPGGVEVSGFGEGNVQFGTLYASGDVDFIGSGFGGFEIFRNGGLIGEITDVGSAPVITQELEGTTNQCGEEFELSVGVSYSIPDTYQWYKGTNAIPGDNSSLIYFSPSAVDDSGLYSVVVMNAFGAVTSRVATVSVVDTVPPEVNLFGYPTVTLFCPGAYVEAGASAYSFCAGTLPVTISGTINPNPPSTNILYYVATDPSGNSTTNTRTVIILAVTNPPAIALNGPNPMQVLVNTPFVDPGASATDFCGSAVSVTTSGTVNTTQPGTYTLTYSASDPDGVMGTNSRTVVVEDTLQCIPAVSNLLGWWTGDGTARDALGQHNGTLVNGATYAPGYVGQAFSLDGVSSYVDLGSWNASDHWTLAAWVNPSSVPSGRHAIVGGVDNCTDWAINLYNGQFGLDYRPADNCSDNLVSSVPVTPGTWYFVVGTFDGNTVSLYVDGVLQQSGPALSGYAGDGTDIRIGGEVCCSGENFGGLIDEVAIYGRALAPVEIANLYNAGSGGVCALTPGLLSFSPTDGEVGNAVEIMGTNFFGVTNVSFNGVAAQFFNSTKTEISAFVPTGAANGPIQVDTYAGSSISSSNFIVTTTNSCLPPPSGMIAWWPGQSNTLDVFGNNGVAGSGISYGPGVVGDGFVFDGSTNAYIEVPAGELNPGPGNGFTIEGWINPVSIAQPEPIIEWTHNGALGPFLWISHEYGSGAGCLYGTYVYGGFGSAPGAIQPGQWQHVAMTYDRLSGVERLFVNGVAVAEQDGGPYFTQTTENFYLGGDYFFGNKFFDGSLDEMTMYNRGLEPGEIAEIYNAGSLGKCPIAPEITNQPASVALNESLNASFAVQAYGTPVLVYQWLHNNVPLSDNGHVTGSTNASLNIQNVTTTDAGSYSVIITNYFGSVTSAVAVLTVTNVPIILVENVTGPATDVSSQPMRVSWIVTNAGMADFNGTFHDSVYLASNPAGTNASGYGTFNFTGTLAAGQSATLSALITPTLDLSGNQWIVIRNDANSMVSGGNSLSNNTYVSANPVLIQPEPLPDLQVAYVDSPPTAFAGQSVTIEFAVTNVGTGSTTTPSWTDGVWLTADGQVDFSATYLGAVPNVTYLTPGGSYVSSFTATLPQQISGNYYFLVSADVYGQVTEYSHTDNIGLSGATLVEIPPLPDLVVPSVIAPPSAFSGQTLSLSWTVRNIGQGPASSGTWYDAVYLSATTNGFNPNNSYFMGFAEHDGALASGASYTVANFNVALPVGISGNYYLTVQADYQSDVYALTHTNSVGFAPVTDVLLTPPPDLAVEQVSAPGAALSGHDFTFTYVVGNVGASVTPNSEWQDSYYLVPNTTHGVTNGILLGTINQSPGLDVGQSYSNTVDFVLPNALSGEYYLAVYADSQNSVFELNKANNIGFSPEPVNIQTVLPDLVVTSIQAPPSIEPGGGFLMNWTVQNVGPGDTAVSTWYDNVYVSSSPSGANSTFLGSYYHVGLLNPGASYTQSNQFASIPYGANVGTYYLFVVANADESVYEGSNSVNETSALLPVSVAFQTADLTAGVINSPSNGMAGDTVLFSWEVTNAGPAGTIASSWNDSIYLSTNSVSNILANAAPGPNDLLVKTVGHYGNLGPGGSYSNFTYAALPTNSAGNWNAYVLVDSSDQVREDTIRTDNISVATNMIDIAPEVPVFPPDLLVSSVTIPTDAFSGQSIPVTWTVTNAGPGDALGGWYDAVYLSLDEFLDRNNAVYLGALRNPIGLTNGGSYTSSATFPVPSGIGGLYYVFVVADAFDYTSSISDTNEDNEGYAAVAMQLTVPPEGDLQAGAVQVPTNSFVGQLAAFTYSVTNEGASSAQGFWTDSLYLSTSNQWSVNDPLIGEASYGGNIPPGSNYSNTFYAPIPGVSPGNYYVIVRPDSHNNLNEDETINHSAVSPNTFNVDVPVLTLGVPQTNSLTSGQQQYYKVYLTAGQNLSLSLTSSSGFSDNELFASYGVTPSEINFDYLGNAPISANQEITISATESGWYYIMVLGDSVPTGTESYSLQASLLEFSVNSVTPNHGGNAGSVTVEIQGGQFTPQTKALLVSGGSSITGVTRMLPNSTVLYATFNLVGASAGTYTVRVQQPNGNFAQLPNSFAVTPGLGGNLQTHLSLPGTVRPGFFYTMTVTYGNVGDEDLPSPLFTITNSENAPMTLSLANPYSTTPIQLMGIAQNGPAGVLPPDSQYTVLVYYQVPPQAPIHTTMYFNLSQQMTDTNAVEWGSVIDPSAPPGLTADAWAAIVNNLHAQMGPDDAHFVQALANDATLFSQEGKLVYSVGELLGFELVKAMNIVTPSHVLAQSTDDVLPSHIIYLSLQRTMPASLDHRFQTGPFGRGWVHNFEYTLTPSTLVSNIMDFSPPNGNHRFFTQQADGSWAAPQGDLGVLQGSGSGIYTLREADGSVDTFDSTGRLITCQDANGNEVLLSYTGGHLTSLTHSDGESIALAYNGSGCVSALTDSAGQTTHYYYDASGQHLTSVVSPGNVTNSYTYEPVTGSSSDHALQSITFPDGSHRYYTYDAQGREIGSSLDNGVEKISLGYDATGDIFETNALGAVSVIQCGERGQPVQITDALGNTTIVGYDAYLNPTTITQPAGQASTFAYDSDSREMGVVDPLGNDVGLSPTNLNRLGTLDNQKSKTTSYTYDSRGNMAGVVYPDQTAEEATFDSSGSVTNYVNRRGQKISYVRNAGGQVTQKTLPGGRVVSYQYDIRGYPTNITDSVQGVISLQYDARGFLTNTVSADGRGLSYSYDNAGHQTQRVGTDGYILNYGYNLVGQLVSLSDGPGTNLAQYNYDAIGELTQETKGNGTKTVYGYDAALNLVAVTNFGADAGVQSFFNYTYSPTHQRLTMTNAAGTTYYQYDSAQELIGVTYPSGRSVSYSYDADGNRTTVDDNGTNATYVVNSMNEYTAAGDATLMYDADGNLTNRTDTAGTTSYQYDSENRLTNVTDTAGNAWSYQYDALGRRDTAIVNGVTNHYLMDPLFGNVLAEYDANGNLTARYDHGIGLASRKDGAGNDAYYAFDALGNTRQLTDQNGALLNSYDYDAFGAVTTSSVTVSNEYQFVGRFGIVADSTGLSFMKNRYYSPELGRFQSFDPIGAGGGINLAKYAGNDPVNRTDITGLQGDPGTQAECKEIVPPGTQQGPPIQTIDVNFGAAAGGGATGGITFSPNGIQIYGGPTTGEGLGVGALFSTSTPTEGKNVAVTIAGPGGAVSVSFSGADADQQAQTFLQNLSSSSWNGLSVEAGPYATPTLSVTVSTYYVSPPVQFDVSYAASYWYNSLIYAFSTRQLNNSTASSSIRTPGDPNDKTGPIGYGPSSLVSATQPLSYTITFANAASNTAPAHTITITDQLDPNLDPRTFRLTEIVFGTNSIPVPANRSFIQTNLMITTAAGPLQVDVLAGVNVATSQLFWSLTSIDPATGETPANPDLGLLPPDTTNGIGEGRVSYTVTPVDGAESGTTVSNEATIVFDNNPPMTTSDVVNTLDAGDPASELTAGPSVATSNTFIVSWSGTDTNGLSGLAGFNIYVSDNGGPYQLWLAGTTLTSAPYVGQPGHTYSFYSIAYDNSGNSQPVPASPEATVYVSNNHPPILAAISNYVINVGSGVLFTNIATDTNIPAETLTFGLLPGAPEGATEDPQTGVFSWTPTAAQGGTTNVIGIAVTNNGNPPLSASQTFTVVVNDYVSVDFGPPATVLASQASSIPINLVSSAGLSNLTFTLTYPAGTLTNLSLGSLAPAVGSAGVTTISSTSSVFGFTNALGQALQGSQQIALLHFTAISAQPSSFVPLTVSAISAIRTNNTSVADVVGIPGTINVVNRQPLIQASPPAAGQIQLTLYGLPGTNYLLQSSSSLRPPVTWQTVQTIAVTNIVQTISLPVAGPGTNSIFYRLEQQ